MSSQAELSKLTIPQLKALCKERRITGYSKLTKPALIEKLLGSAPSNSDAQGTKSISPASVNQIGDVLLASQNALDASTIASKASSATNASKSFDGPTDNDTNISETGLLSQEHAITPQGQKETEPSHTAISVITVPINKKRPSESSASDVFTKKLKVAQAIGNFQIPLYSPGSQPPKATTPSQFSHEGRPSLKGKTYKSTLDPIPSISTIAVRIKKSSNTSNDNVASISAHPSPSSISKSQTVSSDPSQITDVSPFLPIIPSKASDPTHLHSFSSVSRNSQNNAASSQHTPVNSLNVAPKFHTASATQKMKKIIVTSNTHIQQRFKPLAVAQNRPAVKEKPLIITNFNSTYLDFTPTSSLSCADITPISRPPPLSKRSLPQPWAIFLSGVQRPADIRNCLLVSKFFRYAIYLSALIRLKRFFSGSRLTAFLHDCESRHPVRILNFWPYLLQRQRELKDCKTLFEESFLGKLFVCTRRNVISDRVWSALDERKAMNVAVRFWLTRVWSSLSTSQSTSEVHALIAKDVVVDAKPASHCGDIWKVVVQRGHSGQETYYIIEKTGEIVGSSSETNDISDSMPLRTDWASYISSSDLSFGKTTNLLSGLHWLDKEDYDYGIRKHWLRIVDSLGEEGAAMREVAQRYVLASVSSNSYTGKYMTATAMESEFAGNCLGPSVVGSKVKVKKVSMFLPIQHHVDSVHFVADHEKPLHPALAVVFAQGREYYVLRDNGMTVGCEEDGVSNIWRSVLGCGARGQLSD